MKARRRSPEWLRIQIRINAVRTLPDEPGTSPSDAFPAAAPALRPPRTRNRARERGVGHVVAAGALATRDLRALTRADARAGGGRDVVPPHNLWAELGNWDGVWYIRIFTPHGLPETTHHQNPLGFFPLYPLLVLGSRPSRDADPGYVAYEAAGVFVSLITGATATLLIHRLAIRWWGEAAARRVVLFLCFWLGSIVFSMVYTEGLLLTLVAGCMLAIAHRRWVLAGVLAGLSTAVGPARSRSSRCAWCGRASSCTGTAGGTRRRRVAARTAVRPVGALAFAALPVGSRRTPFASYDTQHDQWQESSSPLALLHTAEQLYHQIFPAPGGYDIVNTNYVSGLIGAVILLAGIVLILRAPRPSLEGIIWTLGVAAAHLHLGADAAEPADAAGRLPGTGGVRAAPARALVHRPDGPQRDHVLRAQLGHPCRGRLSGRRVTVMRVVVITGATAGSARPRRSNSPARASTSRSSVVTPSGSDGGRGCCRGRRRRAGDRGVRRRSLADVRGAAAGGRAS